LNCQQRWYWQNFKGLSVFGGDCCHFFEQDSFICIFAMYAMHPIVTAVIAAI
jgi:hypothetical protein